MLFTIPDTIPTIHIVFSKVKSFSGEAYLIVPILVLF